MSDDNFKVAITADDKTKAGVLAAQKSLKGVTKASEQAAILSAGATQRAVTRANKGILSSYSTIQRSTERVFGGSGGVISRITAAGEAGSTLAGGMADAAKSGGVLSAAMGVVGVAAAGVTAVLAGVAIGTDALMKSWANGISGAVRFATTMGLATKSLQEFQAAGELKGIDKGVAGGALAALSQNLNDAKDGRNQNVILGLSAAGANINDFALNKDGTIDAAQAAPKIADLFKGQKRSDGARRLAELLGIPVEAVPLFMQGGAALKQDEAWASRYGAVSTDAQNSKALSWQRRRAMVGQIAGRGALIAGEKGYDLGTGVLDGAVKAGEGIVDGPSGGWAGLVKSGGDMIYRGAEVLKGAANVIAGAVGIKAIPSIEASAGRLSGGSRNNLNVGNMRPVGGGGFQSFGSATGAIAAMARQVNLDQTRHGARNLEELIGGRVGADGKPHWGYSPASDGNNVGAYVAAISKSTGIGGRQAINLSDPETLAKVVHAMIAVEQGRQPFSIEQIRQVVTSMSGSATGKSSMSIQQAAEREGLHVEFTVNNAPHGATIKTTHRGRVSYTDTGR